MRIPHLAFLLLGAVAPSSRAEEPAPPEVHAVDLAVAGDRQDAAALADVVGELLERFDVELRLEYVERFDPADAVTPDGSAPPAVARAWIDLAPELIGEEPTQATLFLADASWERLCVRRVPLADGVDEVAREELAHMLASGVEGLLAGRPLEQSRAEVRVELGLPPEPPPPPPRPPPTVPVVPSLPIPPAPHEYALDLGVGYDVSGFGEGAWVSHGPFVSLGLGLLWLPWRPEVWLTAQVRVPLDVAADPIGVRLDQGVFRLLFSVDVPLVEDFALLVLLGAGMDVVRSTPLLAPGASGRLETPSTAYFALVRAGLGLRWRLFGATELLLALVCDVDAQPRSYWAREGEGKIVVLAPWVVRPLATLTLSTDLLAPQLEP